MDGAVGLILLVGRHSKYNLAESSSPCAALVMPWSLDASGGLPRFWMGLMAAFCWSCRGRDDGVMAGRTVVAARGRGFADSEAALRLGAMAAQFDALGATALADLQAYVSINLWVSG